MVSTSLKGKCYKRFNQYTEKTHTQLIQNTADIHRTQFFSVLMTCCLMSLCLRALRNKKKPLRCIQNVRFQSDAVISKSYCSGARERKKMIAHRLAL